MYVLIVSPWLICLQVQYSMSISPAILHSSLLPAVTQIRASGDYVAGGVRLNCCSHPCSRLLILSNMYIFI